MTNKLQNPINKQLKHKCLRCGHCCMAVGRTFWRTVDFRNYPALEKLAKTTESQDEGLPCGMLDMKGGIASCRIQRIYGWRAKPEVCREYPPFPDHCHQKDKNFKGQGVCYQFTG